MGHPGLRLGECALWLEAANHDFIRRMRQLGLLRVVPIPSTAATISTRQVPWTVTTIRRIAGYGRTGDHAT